MKLQRPIYRSILPALCLAALSQPVIADGISGLYFGASAGIAKISANNAAFQDQLQSVAAGIGTLDFTSASLHDRKTAWWGDVGYMAWPFLGIEASYLHLGEVYNQVDGTFTPTGDAPRFVGAATRLSSKGPALGLLFRVPVMENFDINVRIADYYARTTLTNIFNSTTYTTIVATANRSSLLAAVGASYVFAGHWSARLDYLRIEHAGDDSTGKYNAGVLTLGASYTF
jgi:opacity protein-like surface antigen